MSMWRRRSRTVAAGAVISVASICTAWLPAFSQEDEGGTRFTLGVSTSFDVSDNADLSVISPGDTAQFETTLTFGFESVTRVQALRLSYSDTIREGTGPDANTGFRGPDFAATYERMGANARFSLGARQTTRDIVSDLTEDDLGDADALIADDGTQSVTTLSFDLETGLRGPFGTELSLSTTDQDFSDVTDPDLDESRTRQGSLALVFRPLSTTEARLSFGFIDFEEEDAVGTERITRRVDLTGLHQLSSAATVRAEIGFTEISETQTLVPFSLPDEQGLTALLRYDREAPAGGFSAALSRDVTAADGRTDLSGTRRFELAAGDIEITVGLTAPDSSGVYPFGRTTYSRELEDQSFSLGLSSVISVNSDGELQRDTVAGFNYGLQLNERNNLALDLNFIQTSDVDGSDIVDRIRASTTASYQYRLTSDWTLAAGFTHRLSREDGSSTARSNTAFATLGRSFSWRP